MTTAQLEEAVLSQYDNGRYSPLGADGGVLKYIIVNVNDKQYRASVTLDHEIAKIRRIWQLSEVSHDPLSGWDLNAKDIYDFTKQYYSMR